MMNEKRRVESLEICLDRWFTREELCEIVEQFANRDYIPMPLTMVNLINIYQEIWHSRKRIEEYFLDKKY